MHALKATSKQYGAVVVGLLVLVLSGAGGAAEAASPAPTGGVEKLSLEDLLDWRVTTASRIEEKAAEAPATVYVISKADIRARGYSTLMDVLKDLPGMETVEYYYSEQGSLVPVRGVVGNNKIVLLVNGMRVNPPGGEELMIRNDVSVRFADQIEIIYGPGSTLYGQDAISAVINIKTQEPGDHKVEALGAYGATSAREGFASFGTKLRADTDVPIAVTGYASYKASDLSNFRTEFPDWWRNYQVLLPGLGRDPNADPVRGDLGYNAFARVESKQASVQAWFRESQRSSTEGSGEGGRNPVLYFVDEAKWRDRELVVEGQHTLELGKKVTLRSILTFNRYEVDPRSRYVFPIPPALFLRDFKYGIGTGQTFEEKLDYHVDDRTRLALGVVFGNFDIIAKATVLDGADPKGDVGAQAGTLVYYTRANDPSSAVGIQRAENLQYQQYGAYVEGSHRFTDRLRLIGGLRVDASTRYTDVPFSPRAALLYSAMDRRLTLKYILSMAYVAPPPYFGHNIFDNGVQISSGNSNLQPERALTNEANVTWQTKTLLLSASAFYNHQSNLLITNQSENPETVLPGIVFADLAGTQSRRLTKSVNLGNSNAPGLDLAARYNRDKLSLWASYSYVDFKRDLQGRKSGLESISHHNVRLGLTWSPLSKVSLTPSLVLRSTPVNLGRTYQDAGVSLDSPYEVNFNALFTPSRSIDGFVTVRNVTDNHYALRGVAGPALQEPLAGVAGVRVRF